MLRVMVVMSIGDLVARDVVDLATEEPLSPEKKLAVAMALGACNATVVDRLAHDFAPIMQDHWITVEWSYMSRLWVVKERPKTIYEEESRTHKRGGSLLTADLTDVYKRLTRQNPTEARKPNPGYGNKPLVLDRPGSS